MIPVHRHSRCQLHSSWCNKSLLYFQAIFHWQSQNFTPADATNPYCIFKQFFTDKVIDSIVLATNHFSELCINSPDVQSCMKLFKHSLFSQWYNATHDEICVYLPTIILMGLAKKPEYKSYWSSQHILWTLIFKCLIPCEPFEALRKMIHFTNPYNENPEDSLKKLRTVLDILCEKFLRIKLLNLT